MGEDPASIVYVGKKKMMAAKLGFAFTHVQVPAGATQEDLLKVIYELNEDKRVHGIILQLPVSKHMDHQTAIDTIDPRKDVDGFNVSNIGRLHRTPINGANEPYYESCTPKGIIKILEHLERTTGMSISGTNTVVIGRSDIVGKPIAALLTHKNSTVTLAHSRTKNLKEVVATADIVIAACGQPELVRGDWIKDDAIVVDVGINSVVVNGKKKLVGDVHFESASANAMCVTPVPGGVGPFTVACLMENTLQSAKWHMENKPWGGVKRLLTCARPVPSDIDIAQSIAPGDISTLATQCGLSQAAGEYEVHGKGMAKVCYSMLCILFCLSCFPRMLFPLLLWPTKNKNKGNAY